MKIGVANEETWGFLNEIYAELEAHHQVSKFERPVSPLPFFNERTNRFLLRRNLNRFMKENDVVFFEWASELLIAATHLPKQCGIVTRLHRYEMYKWVHLINWDAVDKVILVSQAKKREFVDRFPEQASKVIVITEAVDMGRFKPNPTPKPFNGDIGILCHIAPRKRVYELVLAFSELAQQRDDLHLHIGGDIKAVEDAYPFAIEDIIQRLNLKDRVTMHGPVSNPQQWYTNHIDILISNSYSEGLQVSPMEAMACECYCLLHHWAGADELLPDEYLFLTDRQLQEKILAYCDLPEAAKLEQKAHMRTIIRDNFDLDKIKVNIRNVIESSASGATPQGQAASVTVPSLSQERQ